MPPLPVIDQTYRVALNWSDGSGQTAANVIHIRKSGAPGSPTALMASLDADVTANMWDATSSQWQVRTVAITPLNGIDPTTFHTPATPANWTGNASGQPVPQVAALVKFTTTQRGRSYRGRIYLPDVAEDVMNAGVISPTVVNNIQVDWTAFIAAQATSTYNLVVASYRHATARDVVTCTAENETATQRRRQGRNR